jgi:hypothetical protein
LTGFRDVRPYSVEEDYRLSRRKYCKYFTVKNTFYGTVNRSDNSLQTCIQEVLGSKLGFDTG